MRFDVMWRCFFTQPRIIIRGKKYFFLLLALIVVFFYGLIHFELFRMDKTDELVVTTRRQSLEISNKMAYGNNDFRQFKMRRHENEVPIVIVDQHQEVIPYWYKAVDEEIIDAEKNTLIHIDAHADMATPENADIIIEHIYERQRKGTSTKNQYSSFLPLMQANDVFIVSAIMTGLINRVIWIRPDWAHPRNQVEVSFAYVGTTELVKGNKRKTTVCECLRGFSLKTKVASKQRCFLLDRENVSMVAIPQSACRKVRPYKLLTFSVTLFKQVFKSKSLQKSPIILDIDEDFFGVQSGVKAFVDSGIPLDVVYVLDEALARMYCPKSKRAEQALDTKLRLLFRSLYNMKQLSVDRTEKEIKEKTSAYFCENGNEALEWFALYLKSISRDVHRALSKVKYCLFNSPRLRETFQNGKQLNFPLDFSLCHGTIFPGDTLNEIFVDSKKGIRERNRNMTDVLEYIFKEAKPRLFTISRSLRDGFTPREHQRFIEKNILESIGLMLRNKKLKEHVIYDEYLSFGKNGWL